MLKHTFIQMCSYLYWGAGVPLASQVRVASSSMESTGMNKSPGSILHLGPWYDPLSIQSVTETVKGLYNEDKKCLSDTIKPP